jgi:predicted porin
MNTIKNAIAFAMIGGIAGAASAQTNVTLYGVVDMGIQQTRLSPGGSNLGVTSGIQSGSRWGLKGTEALGGGMSASFQLESGFDASNGFSAQGGRLFGRQSWLGLNGDFGSVKLGRQYTPIFGLLDTIDPFGTGITGDGSGIAAVFRSHGVRTDNTVNYSMPRMGGLSGEVAYSFGEVTGSTSTGRQIGLGLAYDGGPFTVVFGHHNQNLVTGTTPAGNSKTTMLGGTYDLKAVKLHAAYAINKDKSQAGATTTDSRDSMLGVSAPVGALSLMASYVHRADHLTSNADANYWQLGATYSLSKRTNFYASYSTIRNEAAGSTGSGAAGTDISWLNAGIRHKF